MASWTSRRTSTQADRRQRQLWPTSPSATRTRVVFSSAKTRRRSPRNQRSRLSPPCAWKARRRSPRSCTPSRGRPSPTQTSTPTEMSTELIFSPGRGASVQKTQRWHRAMRTVTGGQTLLISMCGNNKPPVPLMLQAVACLSPPLQSFAPSHSAASRPVIDATKLGT